MSPRGFFWGKKMGLSSQRKKKKNYVWVGGVERKGKERRLIQMFGWIFVEGKKGKGIEGLGLIKHNY